jgi:6-phosphogluconolactonase
MTTPLARLVFFITLIAFSPSNHVRAAAGREFFVYFGTYTGKASKGIYLSRLDLEAGKLTPPELAAETQNPSFLALHPAGKFLYSVGEISQIGPKKTGAVNAFALDPGTGKLTPLNQQESGGAGPCHLVVDKSGQAVLVANYGGGSVASLPVNRDGSLRPAASVIQHTGRSVTPRQSQPNAHSINIAPDNRFAVCADLGLDKLLIYRLDPAKAVITPNAPSFTAVTPASGPRHFAFHPSALFAYVINEINCSLTAFAYDPAAGTLKELQTLSTLPAGESVQKGFSTAEVQVHPEGRFVYGSNRGHDTIAVFSVEAKTGKLALVQNQSTLGKTPRNFGVDPTGRWLLAANQNSDTVALFAIDQVTGKLTPKGEPVAVPAPVCVKFLEVKR